MKKTKKFGMSRKKALWLTTVVMLLFVGLCMFLGDAILLGDYGDKWGWVHNFSMFLSVYAVLFILIILIIDLMYLSESDDGPLKFLYSDYEDDYEENESENEYVSISFKKILIWGVLTFMVFYLIFGVKGGYDVCVNMYNTSKKYQNKYNQKVEEKKGFYDKLWKTYLQKEKITNINKETFIEITKIIMENRKDGRDITWKWIQENQQIPYSEFTSFYTDLSNFITEQREGYFNIEKECQIIANQNNTLLDTFPNNILNKVLKCARIKFEYGFTSDSTETVFKTKKENIK